jgi:hypothetical protein
VSAWWAGLAPAELPVDCGGQQHRVRWADGVLHTLDHDDPDGERALAALGGEPSGCILLLDAWARHADDLQVLVLASRGPADPLAAPEPPPVGAYRSTLTITQGGNRGVQHAGWVSCAPRPRMPRRYAHYAPLNAQPGRLDPDDELGGLLGLGGGVSDRLVATVAATWADRIAVRDERVAGAAPTLQAALFGRVLATLRGWLGEPGLDLELTLCPPGADRSAELADGVVRLTLPFAWLVEVWAPGLATVAGRFCLAARPDGSRWRLTTVGPDCAATRTLTIDVS